MSNLDAYLITVWYWLELSTINTFLVTVKHRTKVSNLDTRQHSFAILYAAFSTASAAFTSNLLYRDTSRYFS